MASTAKIPTIKSKSLTVAIKRAMTLRDIKPRELAAESGVPFGTLRRILELNTVADYEQLSKIAEALRLPLSNIIIDAESLCDDADFVSDYQAEKRSDDTSRSNGIAKQDDERRTLALQHMKSGLDLAAYESEHKDAYIEGDAA